jgi:2'-5' RNA ligase
VAFIGLKLPQEVTRYLASVDVPGDKVDFGHAHVTISMLGKDVPVEEFFKAAAVAYYVVSATAPIICSTDIVSSFPAGGDGYPIICPIVSPMLHELKVKLDTVFDMYGIDYSKKFPEYRPHTTLSYSPEPVDDFGMAPIQWIAHEMTMWGGDNRDDRAVVTLPFNPDLISRAAFSIASVP